MFTEPYAFVKKEEGGYVDNPNDSGGATNGGVTQGTYNLYRTRKKLPIQPVRNITLKEKSEIYEGIWRDCKADKLPAGLSLMHFDFAVNAGNKQAAKILQRSLNVPDDGIIGPQTLNAASSATDEHIIRYAELRRTFYNGLAARRPKDKIFLKGWLLRTNRCERKALSLYHDSKKTNDATGSPNASG